MPASFLKLEILGLLLALIPMVLWVMRKRLYGQSILVIACGFSVACCVIGYQNLTDGIPQNDTLAAVLGVAGIVLLLATALVTNRLHFSEKKAGQPSAPAAGVPR